MREEESDRQARLPEKKPFFLFAVVVGNIFLHWNHFNSLESEATRPPRGLEAAAAAEVPVSPAPDPEPEPARAILLRKIEFLRPPLPLPPPPTRPIRPNRPTALPLPPP